MQKLKMFLWMMVVLSGSILLAQSPPGPGRVKNACEADIQKFCAGIEHGQGRVFQCLKQNEASLDATCKASLDRAKARVQKGNAACHDDVLKFCADVERGKGNIRQCLKKNEAELSPACKKHIEQRPGRQNRPNRPGK